MPRYSVSSQDGTVISNHFTPLGALRKARNLALAHQELVISEYNPSTAKTGRTVMHVRFDMETNWRGDELQFWNDGSPII